MSRQFEGRTVAITGAAGGIGQWLCRFFGAQGAVIARALGAERGTVHPLVVREIDDIDAGVGKAGAILDAVFL